MAPPSFRRSIASRLASAASSSAPRTISLAKDRPRAPGQVPTPDSKSHTEIYNYFTVAGATKLLHSAQGWVTIRLTLENAGPVTIGTNANLLPVLSGKGILLPTSQEVSFVLSKTDRLYIAAEAINRVKVIIEPIPYEDTKVELLQQILAELRGRK